MPEFYHKSEPEEHIAEVPLSQASEGENDPVKTFITWVAPSRPFRKKDRSYFTTIAIIVVLLILISLLAREFILIGVLLAVAFVVYVLAFVPPSDVEYKISTQGIIIGDHFYFWGDLNSFWFSKKEGLDILNVNTNLRFPGRLLILVEKNKIEEIKKIIAKYLLYYEIPPKNLMDNWSEGLQKHFPMENPQK